MNFSFGTNPKLKISQDEDYEMIAMMNITMNQWMQNKRIITTRVRTTFRQCMALSSAKRSLSIATWLQPFIVNLISNWSIAYIFCFGGLLDVNGSKQSEAVNWLIEYNEIYLYNPLCFDGGTKPRESFNLNIKHLWKRNKLDFVVFRCQVNQIIKWSNTDDQWMKEFSKVVNYLSDQWKTSVVFRECFRKVRTQYSVRY